MSLTAEFQLRSPQQPLSNVARAVPDLTIQLEGAEQPRIGPMLFLVRVVGPSFDGLEPAFENSPLVREHSLISEVGSTRLYQLTMTMQRPQAVEEMTSAKIVSKNVTVLSHGWRVTLRIADRDALAEVREFARSKDVPFYLERLYESTSTDADLIGLTDKQREALLAAFELGYYDVPRQASMTAVATELDISPSALAERLHRAQAHLVEHFVRSAGLKTPADLDTS